MNGPALEALVGLVVLGGLVGLMVCELVWGWPEWLREILAPGDGDTINRR